ncbi:MAG: putative toxin-antitoxin system toxin component, PIN family [Betaproteobacteria bacterium]|nr:putative toxin-antitoxin system toxin component, PIN family [Betaproteobacteria bacterium]
MSRPPAVVLDTNVVLSALLFGKGRLAGLRQAWQKGHCQPLVSRPTVAEFVRALPYPKFDLSPDDQHELLADYLPFCTTVRMPSAPPQTPTCRDPFDRSFLELAVVGKADYLVTGDKDVLALAQRFACSIVTPEQFLSELRLP